MHNYKKKLKLVDAIEKPILFNTNKNAKSRNIIVKSVNAKFLKPYKEWNKTLSKSISYFNAKILQFTYKMKKIKQVSNVVIW